MAQNRCPFLKVIEQNLGPIDDDPENWTETEWLIFTDGSYEVLYTFIGYDTKTTGKMSKKDFAKLQETIKCEPWLDPAPNIDACDGESWAIESYRSDGSIEKTSGKMGYTHGNQAFKTIVSLLPIDGGFFTSNSFFYYCDIDD